MFQVGPAHHRGANYVLLLLNGSVGERLVRSRVDMEAVLFLLSLFVMVAAVRRTGLFTEAAHRLFAAWCVL